MPGRQDIYRYTINNKSQLSNRKILSFMKRYTQILRQEDNYPNPGDKLEDWIDPHGHTYSTSLHPVQEFVISRLMKLDVKSVLDIGAGPGLISKFIYARFQDEGREIALTCLEHSKIRVELMKSNFDSSTQIIEPFRDILANIINSHAGKLPLRDDSIDVAFTCTVLQHLPFPYSIDVVKEMARVSSKYVLHVEGFHPDGIIRTRKTRLGRILSKKEELLPSLPYLYDSLGFDTLELSTGKFPYQEEYRYYIFLGRKRT
jgi:SAM-dependent methyltransferase